MGFLENKERLASKETRVCRVYRDYQDLVENQDHRARQEK